MPLYQANLKKVKNTILSVVLCMLLSTLNGQTELRVQHEVGDTIYLEMQKYLSVPGFRHSSSLKCITKVALVPIASDTNLCYRWHILNSKLYHQKYRQDFVALENKLDNFYDDLSLEFEITKEGELVQLMNFKTLKDSLYVRHQVSYHQDSTNGKVHVPNTDNDVDLELFDYVNRSAVDENAFMDIHFPEVLLYFQVNNQSFDLYKSVVEQVKTTFRKMVLYEIDMLKNTMLVFDNAAKSEVEIEFELTNEGCQAIQEQLTRRVGSIRGLNIDKVESFECQRSRIIQRFKYDKSEQKIKSVYEKKTLTINDEPCYFWTELRMK